MLKEKMRSQKKVLGNFFNDLGVDTMDPVTLVISYHMGAINMGEYKKSEFKHGFQNLGCSTVAEIKAKVPKLRKQIQDKNEFPKIYKFVFNFLKGEVARNVNIDHAIAMWDLLLKEYYGSKIDPFLEKWKAFLENQKENKNINGIKKDEWNSLLDLFQAKGIDVNNMKGSEEECWPILFDNFFEYME